MWQVANRALVHVLVFQGIPYEIDDFVEIWPTPGHTGADVSVIVRGTKHGVVAVVGR